MPTYVTDPYSLLAESVEQTILDEFPDIEYINVLHDRIHESMGADGQTYVGISPGDQGSSGIVLTIELLIQFYGPFTPDVNPFQHADPRIYTTYAERLRQALSKVRTTGTSEVWFFDVTSTRFPIDATGNKTRFEMVVVGMGQNSALTETTG